MDEDPGDKVGFSHEFQTTLKKQNIILFSKKHLTLNSLLTNAWWALGKTGYPDKLINNCQWSIRLKDNDCFYNNFCKLHLGGKQ